MSKAGVILLIATILGSPVAFGTVALAAKEVRAVELKDGQKVQIEGEMVYVLDDKGQKSPAPDGTWETKDGQKIVTKDGRQVKSN